MATLAAIVGVLTFFFGDNLVGRVLAPPTAATAAPDEVSSPATASTVKLPSADEHVPSATDLASESPVPNEPSVDDSPSTTYVEPTTYLTELKGFDVYSDGLVTWERDAAAINGDTFPRSLVDHDVYLRSSITYDLGRDFSTFSSIAGVLDRSAEGSKLGIKVYVDGKEVFDAPATLDQPVRLHVDVKNALHLRLELVNLNPAEVRRPQGGFGDPQIVR